SGCPSGHLLRAGVWGEKAQRRRLAVASPVAILAGASSMTRHGRRTQHSRETLSGRIDEGSHVHLQSADRRYIELSLACRPGTRHATQEPTYDTKSEFAHQCC